MTRSEVKFTDKQYARIGEIVLDKDARIAELEAQNAALRDALRVLRNGGTPDQIDAACDIADTALAATEVR